MGGEKVDALRREGVTAGSPPRGRRKAGGPFYTLKRDGITPAWAEKRLTRPAMTGTPRDHPRVGGEKRPAEIDSVASLGSPPRGRGKGKNANRAGRAAGITPAWAGKSRAEASCGCARRDHPRVGEEKKALLTVRQALKGSPPRRRGKGSSRPA